MKRSSLSDLAIGLGLVLSILAVYAQVIHFQFIPSDDDQYISRNPVIQNGLTFAGMVWSLTASAAANWLPVTLISHMLDVQLFGLNAGMHHLMNVFYHALAALALFLMLRRATGAHWPSAFVAFLFALHPLHVESVAWISERKDVLSALFFFLTLYAYTCYSERPGLARYLLVVAVFALDLMSKPMVVTLPFVLLLFDYWPLRRPLALKLLWEKLPLLAMSACASIVTYRIQKTDGAVNAVLPLVPRVAKALISYAKYIEQTFWPVRLAVFYPYPKVLPGIQAVLSLALIVAVSVVSVRARRTRPYLAVGWFFFLGTLVPVIGIVQAGAHAHADRYMYIPMVGLTIMIGWLAAEFDWRVMAAAGVLCCIACLILTALQTAYWRNPETLYERTIAVTAPNWWAESNLGAYLTNYPDRAGEAVDHLRVALQINPDDGAANNDMGTCLLRSDLSDDAIPYFQAALRLDPNMVSAHFNLASALSKHSGREQEAAAQYEAGLSLRPGDPQAHRFYGHLLMSLGQTRAALAHLEQAQRIQPDEDTASAIETLRRSVN